MTNLLSCSEPTPPHQGAGNLISDSISPSDDLIAVMEPPNVGYESSARPRRLEQYLGAD